MKSSVLVTFLFLSILTYAQEDFSGTWLLPDNDKDTPVAIDFKSNGEFVIVDVHESPTKAFSTVEGYYHFEADGSTLVTITWEGDEVVTSRYQLDFQNNRMILKEVYPNNVSYMFTRPRETNIMITKI